MTFLLKKLFGVPLWILLGVVILLLALIVLWPKKEEDTRAVVAETVIERAKEAKDAREEINSDGGVLYSQCVRSSRTPENCKRFMPDVSAGNR